MNSFLEKDYANAIIEESWQPTAEVLKITFAQAVLAIGSNTCLLRTTSTRSSKAAQETRQRLIAALECFQSVRNLRDELLKLQVRLCGALLSVGTCANQDEGAPASSMCRCYDQDLDQSRIEG